MTFLPNIPQADNIVAASQGDLLNNNQALELVFAQDHVTWDAGVIADRGKHQSVHLKYQVSPPTTSTNESAVWSRAYNATSQLVFTPLSSGSPIAMISGVPTASTSGFTYLPGPGNGLILAWGQATAPNNTIINVTSISGCTFTSTIFAVLSLNAAAQGGGVVEFYQWGSLSTTGFTLTLKRADGNPQTIARPFTYCVIGPA